jgi:hypothetical protein
MSTCPPNLTHLFLTVCKIITFKVDKNIFLTLRPVEFWRPKNHFFGYIWNEPLWIPNYRWVRYMSTKSHIHKREHWEKNHFPQGVMLKFTYKGRFLTIKKTYKKLLYWKSKWWTHTFLLPLHIEIFISEKH